MSRDIDVEYAPGFVFVNVYEYDRILGGPEEGEWYYTAGTLVASRQVLTADADRVQAELQAKYPEADNRWHYWDHDGTQLYFDDYPEPSEYSYRELAYRYDSVNYRGGDYRVHIEDVPGADFPAVTPCYE